MNKIKYIKTQDEQGEISENLFISADAINIDLQDGTNVQVKINNIDNYINELSNRIVILQNTYEQLANKVAFIDEESTDIQYPTAKCIYDLVGNVEQALDILIGEEGE